MHELRLYLASRFCAATAMTLLRTALLWHVWDLTHSEVLVGTLGLVQVVPAIGLSLVGGALADAVERRRIVQVAQAIAVFFSATLCGITFAGGASIGVLYVVAACLACCAAFENPARMALLPTLVERESLARAVTYNSTVQALSFATGPAIAGGLIAVFNVTAAYVAHAVLLLSSVIVLVFVKPRLPATPRAVSWSSMKEGIHFVVKSPVLLSCMCLDLFAVTFGGAAAMLPVYAERILQVGAPGYGLLTGALDAGALVMSVVLVRLPNLRRAGPILLATVALYGLFTISFGLSTSFPLSLLLYAGCGMADQVSVVLRQNAVQLSTPDELRGRVSAVNMIFIQASNQLSLVESGFVAALVGPVATVVSGGVGVVIVVLAVAVLVPSLRRFELPK